MKIGLGQMGIPPREFQLMTLREFMIKKEGHEETLVEKFEAEWTRTHWLGWITAKALGATKSSFNNWIKKPASQEQSTPIIERSDFTDEAKRIFATKFAATWEEEKARIERLKKGGNAEAYALMKQHTQVIENG